MIATRMRDTAFKRTLKTMPIGTTVQIEGPSGELTLRNDPARPAVFLAGGIGITPFRSMLVEAAHQKLPHRIAGPPDMVKDLHAMLTKQSVNNADIHAEEFSGY